MCWSTINSNYYSARLLAGGMVGAYQWSCRRTVFFDHCCEIIISPTVKWLKFIFFSLSKWNHKSLLECFNRFHGRSFWLTSCAAVADAGCCLRDEKLRLIIISRALSPTSFQRVLLKCAALISFYRFFNSFLKHKRWMCQSGRNQVLPMQNSNKKVVYSSESSEVAWLVL